ncbi:MAG: DUF3784 domain-containing protein [Clostridia bacterium]|nr:DUF3784 domain-containing protein [Clostridia bacterium]
MIVNSELLITEEDIMGLIIVGCISLMLLIISLILLRGKGAGLIAGYNTSGNKEEFDSEALCKFVGKILLPIALLSPSVAVGGIYKIPAITVAYSLIVTALVIFALIYANTGNRFKR